MLGGPPRAGTVAASMARAAEFAYPTVDVADIRIISYLPNPRLFKATIAARYSGAVIETLGDAPTAMPGWLWDYEAREMTEADKSELSKFARTAKTGFQGTLYKTDAFLEANPFGDIPAAFGEDGRVGLFESNSIMRAAARLGPNAPALYGNTPLQQSRVDAFLDRTLLFARDIQTYILAGQSFSSAVHETMQASFSSYLAGIEQSLSHTRYIAGAELSLADVVFACELCLLTNERYMSERLQEHGLPAILPQLRDYPGSHRHLGSLVSIAEFDIDLNAYRAHLPLGPHR